jgi:hypothetical protein
VLNPLHPGTCQGPGALCTADCPWDGGVRVADDWGSVLAAEGDAGGD